MNGSAGARRRLPGPLRRLRTFAGQLGLLAVLGLVAALLVTGAPRLANRYADQGLGQDVGALPYQVRDLLFGGGLTRGKPPLDPAVAEATLDPIRQRLQAPLPDLVNRQWFVGQIGPKDVAVSGDKQTMSGSCRPNLPLRYQPGLERVSTVVEGHWPANRGATTVEVAVSRAAADATDLRVGDQFSLVGQGFSRGSVPVRVVGIYQAADPAAPDWDGAGLVPIPCPDPTAGGTWQAPLLTDLPGLTTATLDLPADYTWRYRVDERRLTTAGIPDLMAAIGQARRPTADDAPRLATGLDTALSTFDGQLRSVQALLAVVQAGILTTVLGLVVLAARLAVERRREELTLLRARGGAIWTIGGRTLAEAVLVMPVAVLVGWAVGGLLPGRPSGLELPLLVALLVGTTLAVPLLAMSSQRGMRFLGQRRDLVRHRPTVRRLTAEALVLLLAVLGVVLLRRRGLSQSSGVDPYLASVPVLLAVAAALVALRLVPGPLRLLGRLAARARTVVPFVGLARAGRAAPVTVFPAAILVVAIAIGVFTSVVTSTIGEARDQVSNQEVGGDARIVSNAFTAEQTAERLAALPGVTAVSAVGTESGQPLRVRNPDGTGGRPLGQAQILVVDGPALARVLGHSGIDAELPAAFTRPGRIDGPVPAVVSPDIAEDFRREEVTTGVTDVQGRRYGFTVDAVRSTFPGLPVDARRFVVLPWQALPVPDFQPIRPSEFLVAGTGVSTTALREAVEAGQREYLSRLLGEPADEVRTLPVTVTTWQEHRRTLEGSGVNRLLSFTFTAGVAGALALALLAVGFAVLAEAPARGRVLSRLRTMGLSGRQGRGLLVYELVPLVGVAVLAGGLVGVLLPRLLGPALGLSGFTGGLPARVHVDPLLVVGVLLLVVVALVTALGIESLVNRRMRLGKVLRLGEEN
ncbi:FtsX-like permease family protein [Plantactinospora sp. B5E13]|uniref:FtsX-like permease family protein n=1 Tax=unclassified Plantactinospora TaxID=2631981 RepID=UPI00325E7E2F